MQIKKVWSITCLLCWKTKWRSCPPWVGGWGHVAVLLVCKVWGVCWRLKWSASLAWWCWVLLFLPIAVKSLSSTFGCFVEIQWFLITHVVGYLCSATLSLRDLLISPMYWAVQLWTGHSSDRLCQFSEHLELDLLDAWVKTWWCWCLYIKLTMYFARLCLYC